MRKESLPYLAVCFQKILLAVFFSLVSTFIPSASVAQQSAAIEPMDVKNDRGGSLRSRIYEIRELRRSGRPVRITGGVCYSTCTMFLGLPQTCIAPNTIFGFHGPSSYGKPLEPAVFDHASKLILEHYPTPLQQWYWDTARYELRQLYKLNGAELIRIGVKQC